MPSSAKFSSKATLPQLVRFSGYSALGFVVLGLVIPYISLAPLYPLIRSSLQATLGRSVTFSSASVTLFTGPALRLENVLIAENHHYGLEPVASVPVLDVGLRPDQLLFGRLQPARLRLIDPSLNLVKRADDTWNVVELLQHVGTRRFPLNLVPLLEVVNGRVDFKFGTRKTTLYLLNADLRLYAERLGRVSLEFSASPARTDRAGNGFGHVRGRVGWWLDHGDMDGEFDLDPSNLGELATLVEGHDLGIHGTVKTHFTASGTADRLHLVGGFELSDVHRWDLLAPRGESWYMPCEGFADLPGHALTLKTQSNRATPIDAELRLTDFLRRPQWSASARITRMPLAIVIPLARRMGFAVPETFAVSGVVDGELKGEDRSGFQGAAQLLDVAVESSGGPPLKIDRADLAFSGTTFHLEPASISVGDSTVIAGGQVSTATQETTASISTQHFPVVQLETLVSKGVLAPLPLPLLTSLHGEGDISCQLTFHRAAAAAQGRWTGDLQFARATLQVPGLAVPLTKAEGRFTVDGDQMELSRFSALLDDRTIRGSYQFVPLSPHPERLRFELASADLEKLPLWLRPALEGQGWLARFRVERPELPDWLAQRNMEGDMLVRRVSAGGTMLGPLSSHFIWSGPNIQFLSLRIGLSPGGLRADGNISLASNVPQYNFRAAAEGFAWHGGTLDAKGVFRTSGASSDLLRHLSATGTFSGLTIQFNPDLLMQQVRGDFAFSSARGWPDLRLENMEAQASGDTWTGSGGTSRDGRLLVDLEHETQNMKVETDLAPAAPPSPLTVESLR